MGECEKLKDRFLSFEELNAHDRTDLLNHIATCEKCRQAFTEQKALLTALADYDELSVSDEQLLRYAIQKARPDESDFDGRFLTTAELADVEKALIRNPALAQRVKKFTDELNGAEDFFEQAGLPDIRLDAAPSRPPASTPLASLIRKALEFFRKPIPRLLPIPALAAVLLIFVILPNRLKTDNPYYAHALVHHSEFSFITRGQIEPSLESAYAAFQAQDMPLAIQKFERLEAGQSDPRFLARLEYALGISYLVQAPQKFLWVEEDFDRKNVGEGIRHLEKAARLTDVDGLRENCYWYLGKAHLMLQDKEEALRAFGQVMELKGRRYMAAANLSAILRH